MPYKIIKSFTVATKDIENLTFPAGTFIDDYKRSDKAPKIAILSNYQTYLVEDFDIENYVEYVETIGEEKDSDDSIDITKFTPEEEKSINERFLEDYEKRLRQQADRTYRPNQEQPYTVQVEMINSRYNLNNYLKTIPGKNVIDIKPMENNCYLVIYKEIEE